MTVEFRPTVKSINIASEDLTKITLEVKNGSLDGKYDDIRKLSGKTVNILIIPESYNFTIPFDRSTDSPTQRYKVAKDGTVEFIKEEQTQLDVDGKGSIDIINKTFSVDKDIIDQYILNAPNIKHLGAINPREALSKLNDGISMADVADYFEMSESSLLTELEHARAELAGYAHAWNEAKEKGDVSETEETEKVKQEEHVDTTDVKADSVSENENDEKRNTEEEVEEPSETADSNVESAENEDDPY